MKYADLAILQRWQQIAVNLLAQQIAQYFTEEFGYAQPSIQVSRFGNGSPIVVITWHLFNQIDQELVLTVNETTVVITPRVAFGNVLRLADCLFRHDVNDPNPLEDEGFIYNLERINDRFSHFSTPAAIAN